MMNHLLSSITSVNMTRAIVEDCLINSPMFRNAVIDKILVYSTVPLHNELLVAMQDSYRAMNKIAFIKRVREISEGRVNEFITAYPTIVEETSYVGRDVRHTTLKLEHSKKLAEYYIETFNR
jgi:hypothetical protein